MNEYVAFITNHWVLSALFVIIIAALIVQTWMTQRLGNYNVTPELAVSMINHQDAVVLDIRGESPFAEGHIVGAHNIPSHLLEKKLGSLQKYQDKPIILVCALGQEASKFYNKLKQQDFQVFVLQGGLQAWKTAGLPVVK